MCLLYKNSHFFTTQPSIHNIGRVILQGEYPLKLHPATHYERLRVCFCLDEGSPKSFVLVGGSTPLQHLLLLHTSTRQVWDFINSFCYISIYGNLFINKRER